MKILQINSWYNEWSTGKIVADLDNYISSLSNQSYVLYGRGQKSKNKNAIMCSSNLHSKFNSLLTYITGNPYGGFLNTFIWIKMIKKIKPDIIHIHCTNSFVVNTYKLLKYIGKKNYKVVITLHAEFFYTANCGYSLDCEKWKIGCGNCPRLKEVTRIKYLDKTHSNWVKMQKALERIKVENRKIVCVSNWVKDRASISSFFINDKIEVILNGIDTNIFNYNNKNEFNKNKYNVLFSVPNFDINNDDIKGCADFLRIVKSLNHSNEIHFYIVGKNTNNYKFSNYPNITYLGYIQSQNELAKIYSAASVVLLLSKKETFSLVTAESLCCGTPVIGFNSGAPEQISIKEYSKFIERNINDMVNLISNKPFTKINKKQISDISIKKYSKEIMLKKYISIYAELINK